MFPEVRAQALLTQGVEDLRLQVQGVAPLPHHHDENVAAGGESVLLDVPLDGPRDRLHFLRPERVRLEGDQWLAREVRQGIRGMLARPVQRHLRTRTKSALDFVPDGAPVFGGREARQHALFPQEPHAQSVRRDQHQPRGAVAAVHHLTLLDAPTVRRSRAENARALLAEQRAGAGNREGIEALRFVVRPDQAARLALLRSVAEQADFARRV